MILISNPKLIFRGDYREKEMIKLEKQLLNILPWKKIYLNKLETVDFNIDTFAFCGRYSS